MKSNIVLIGFMGTGKSVVGKKLAQTRQMAYCDIDREIEALVGMTINDIFRIHGEPRFRGEEKSMVNKTTQMTNTVISTGGGIVLSPDNMEKLSENGIIVALDASPITIYQRVSKNRNRPLVAGASFEEVKEKYLARKPRYETADITIDTTDQSIDRTIEQINEAVERMRG